MGVIEKSLIALALVLLVLKPCLAQTDSVSYLLGRFDATYHPDFVRVPANYADREGFLLRKETFEAFKKMADEAKKQGISLQIISATRNFNRQKKIWEGKWSGATKVEGRDLSTLDNEAERARIILRYSSMPGTSRHHWGTDIDINSLSPAYFKSGKGKKELDWLEANAEKFGFCRPYAGKGVLRQTGYEDEAWHWSYQPLSAPLLNAYMRLIDYGHLNGFKGADQAKTIRAIEDYVNGVVGCH